MKDMRPLTLILSHKGGGNNLRFFLLSYLCVSACIFAFYFIFSQELHALEKSKTPPVSPAWVFDHWVWEDDENTEDAVMKMIDGYEKHGIPVGAVILDSPWSTEYNNFIVDEKKYPNFKKFVEKLHAKGIKVVLWVTAMVNESYEKDAKSEPSSNKTYKEGKEKEYFINGGGKYKK